MRHYADSSFLASCYLLDANSSNAKTYLTRTGAVLPFTALHQLEVRNAFELGVFRGLVARTDVTAAWNNLKADVRAGRLVRISVKWPLVSVLRRIGPLFLKTFPP